MERTADAREDVRFVRSPGHRTAAPNKESPMYVRIVTFRLDGVDAVEYQHHAVAVAPSISAWPGLLAKAWIADHDANTYGGVYLFADRGAADLSRDTEVYRAMTTNPAFADVAVREFDVLDEPTAITAAVFAVAHASGSN
jgi:hypothetical protein